MGRCVFLCAPICRNMVRWMSGLVTGLQNRLQRFESASDLKKTLLQALVEGFLIFYAIPQKPFYYEVIPLRLVKKYQ